MNESQIAKIKFRARRGMLELDILFNDFIQKNIHKLTPQELDIFIQLLDYSDPQLYAFLLHDVIPENMEIRKIVKLIKIHRKNTSIKE